LVVTPGHSPSTVSCFTWDGVEAREAHITGRKRKALPGKSSRRGSAVRNKKGSAGRCLSLVPLLPTLLRGVPTNLGFVNCLVEKLDGSGAMSSKLALGLLQVTFRLPHVFQR